MTDTIGPQLPQPDPRGILTFEWLPDDLRNAEDSTQVADQDAHDASMRSSHVRSATPAERALLQHLGYDVPAQLRTRVSYLSNHVRRRTWPALELQVLQPITEGEEQ